MRAQLNDSRMYVLNGVLFPLLPLLCSPQRRRYHKAELSKRFLFRGSATNMKVVRHPPRHVIRAWPRLTDTRSVGVAQRMKVTVLRHTCSYQVRKLP